MTTFTRLTEAGAIPIVPREPMIHVGRHLGGWPSAILRWLRVIAWRVLDLGTEFEVYEHGGKTWSPEDRGER